MTSKQIARLEKYIAKLESLISQAKERIAELESQISQARKELQHWEKELRDAEKRLRLTKPATGFFDADGCAIREGDRVKVTTMWTYIIAEEAPPVPLKISRYTVAHLAFPQIKGSRPPRGVVVRDKTAKHGFKIVFEDVAYYHAVDGNDYGITAIELGSTFTWCMVGLETWNGIKIINE